MASYRSTAARLIVGLGCLAGVALAAPGHESAVSIASAASRPGALMPATLATLRVHHAAPQGGGRWSGARWNSATPGSWAWQGHGWQGSHTEGRTPRSDGWWH